MTNTEPTTQPQAIDLEAMVTQALATFSPTDAAIAEIGERYGLLEVAGIDDDEGLALVHAARMDMRGLRVGVDKVRKELKAGALEYNRRVESRAKEITAKLLPIEGRLSRIEDGVAEKRRAVRDEAARAERLRLQKRVDEMGELGSPHKAIEILSWDDVQFCEKLALAQHAYGVRKAEKAEEEQARKAKAARDLQEREELERELERARVEQAKAEALAKERRAKEVAQLEAQRAEQQAERDRLEKRRAELKQQEHVVELEKARLEAAAEAKRKAKQEEEERRVLQQIEAEAALEEEARLEALRPQHEKIRTLAGAVRDLVVPEVDCSERLVELLEQVARRIEGLAK